jgi:hypothetical protein
VESIETINSSDVGSFLDFECPGENVTDDGRTIQLQCMPTKLYEVKYLPGEWPVCREPVVCPTDTVGAQLNLDSGDL